MSGRLSAQDRAIYRCLTDVLLPAESPLPAASEAGVADEILDRILQWRPDLAADFYRGLSMSRDLPPEESIELLERTDHAAFEAIRFAALGAYYLNPAVRQAIGYRGQESRPVPVDEKPDYLRPGLLDPGCQARGALA